MRRREGRRLLVVAVSAVVLLLAVTGGCTPAEPESIVVKFAHGYSATGPEEKTVDFFCKTLTEATGGVLQFERYPGGQLYKDTECHVAIRDGSIDMTVGSVLKGLQDFDQGWLIFNCPFLFRSWDHIERYMNTDYGKAILKATEAAGAHHLGWQVCHMTRIYNGVRPIDSVEDLRGLKLRVPGGKEMMLLGDKLGFSAVSVAWGEIVTALETGMIDGLVTTPSPAGQEELDLPRNTPYFLDCVLGVFPGDFLVNTKFWEGLPSDIRAKIEAAMPKIEEYSLKLKEDDIAAGLAQMKAESKVVYTVPTPDFMAALEAASRPAWEPVAEKIGWDAINTALTLAK